MAQRIKKQVKPTKVTPRKVDVKVRNRDLTNRYVSKEAYEVQGKTVQVRVFLDTNEAHPEFEDHLITRIGEIMSADMVRELDLLITDTDTDDED